MRNVTISVDEKTYEMAKEYASKQGLSMSKLFIRAMRSLVGSAQSMTPEEFFALADDLPKDRKPLNWNREEVHERGKGVR